MKDLMNLRNQVRTQHLESGVPSKGNWRENIEREIRSHLKKDKENVEKYKKGGPVKKKAGGSMDKTIYEKHELGEHSTTKAPHINYSAEMKGEHPIKYKKGGCKKMKMGGELEGLNNGGTVKMALGGAGKVRKKMSTMKGKACK